MIHSDNKSYIIVISILLVITIGLSVFVAYDKIINKETKTTTINDIEIDLNVFHQIEKTLDKMDNAFNDTGSSYCGYIYKDKLKASNFDMGAAIFVAAKNDLITSNTPQLLVGGKVKNSFEKIFGDNITYQPTSIDAGNYKLAYDQTSNTYAYSIAPKTNQYESKYHTIDVETKLQKEKIIVTRKVFFVEYGSDDGVTINKALLYKDATKQHPLGEIKLTKNYLNENEVIAKLGSKLNTYKYEFNEKTTDNYSFYSIERIRR